jgi:hypothetical protein
MDKVILAADENQGYNFETSSSGLSSLLPDGIISEEIYRGQLGTSTARTQLLESFNLGPLIINYMGHGTVDMWQGGILASADAATLTNGPEYPLVVGMTCLNGMFHDLYNESLAEALIKPEQGGAIAVWTSSGLTTPDKQLPMSRELFRQLFNDEDLTIGEAVMRAKQATSDLDVRRTWILFGDPSLKLKR